MTSGDQLAFPLDAARAFSEAAETAGRSVVGCAVAKAKARRTWMPEPQAMLNGRDACDWTEIGDKIEGLAE